MVEQPIAPEKDISTVENFTKLGDGQKLQYVSQELEKTQEFAKLFQGAEIGQTQEDYQQKFAALSDADKIAQLGKIGDLTWKEGMRLVFVPKIFDREFQEKKFETGSAKYSQVMLKGARDAIDARLSNADNTVGNTIREQQLIIEDTEEALKVVSTLGLTPEQEAEHIQKYQQNMEQAQQEKSKLKETLKQEQAKFKDITDQHKQIDASLQQYEQMSQLISAQRRALHDKNKEYKTQIEFFEKSKAPESANLLPTIKQKQTQLAETLKNTKAREEELNKRTKKLRESKEQIAPFVVKINNMGKTDKEIAKEKRDKERAKKQPAQQASEPTAAATEQVPTNGEEESSLTSEQQTEEYPNDTETQTTTAETEQDATTEPKQAAQATETQLTPEQKKEKEDQKLTETKKTANEWIKLLIPEEENYEEAKKYFTRPDRIYNTKFSGNEANNYLFQYYKEYKNRPGAKQQAREKVLSVIK